ncbi:MAG: hypothetical protein ACREEM_05725 [Blastocatellia bacterium]
MHGISLDRQPVRTVARCSLQSLFVTFFLLIAIFASTTLGQSGRKSNQHPLPDNSRAEKSKSREQISPLSFIVATAPSPYPDNNYQFGFSPLPNLEYLARGGCVVELKNVPGIKVIEDEDVSRYEAREMALTEDDAWIIWIEPRVEQAYPTLPRIRYLLFQPGTGKIVASGNGVAYRPTWGKPIPRQVSWEDEVQNAGRDIAKQVLKELKIAR